MRVNVSTHKPAVLSRASGPGDVTCVDDSANRARYLLSVYITYSYAGSSTFPRSCANTARRTARTPAGRPRAKLLGTCRIKLGAPCAPAPRRRGCAASAKAAAAGSLVGRTAQGRPPQRMACSSFRCIPSETRTTAFYSWPGMLQRHETTPPRHTHDRSEGTRLRGTQRDSCN